MQRRALEVAEKTYAPVIMHCTGLLVTNHARFNFPRVKTRLLPIPITATFVKTDFVSKVTTKSLVSNEIPFVFEWNSLILDVSKFLFRNPIRNGNK